MAGHLCGLEMRSAEGRPGAATASSIGMRMAAVPAGSFRMGELNATPLKLGGPLALVGGDYDEKPVRTVTLSRGFSIGETEVTAAQFRLFRPGYQGGGLLAQGISWNDAVAFCRWLSEKEGKPYRLPTEAEWEYSCRAGTETPFNSGDDAQASPDEPNKWGLKGMHTGGPEWCLDWHGLYPDENETDPVGPAAGWAKVVRGGGIFETIIMRDKISPDAGYYARSANRGGITPSYSKADGTGRATFRVVQAPMPPSTARPCETPFIQQALKENRAVPPYTFDPNIPFYRMSPALPIPPENTQEEGGIEAAALPAGVVGHNHSPTLVECPNGDLLVVYYSTSNGDGESWPNLSFVGIRRRLGSLQWDPPEVLIDIPDVNEYHMILWRESSAVWMFAGALGLKGIPFGLSKSTDNGATWNEFVYPTFAGPIGPFDPKPINFAFRDKSGRLYVATDGVRSTSVLWASDDNGVTFHDTGGRTHGRHTVFVVRRDGSFLGMGGKETNVDGFMPKSISSDGGKTWKKEITPFAALGGNQRPAMIRLASGRLFFAGDFQTRDGAKQPRGINQFGAYVALSDDDGETWRIKRLPGALPHESGTMSLEKQKIWSGDWSHDYATLGYASAAQTRDGIVHLMTSMNHPNQHFELNEAWILSDAETGPQLNDDGNAGTFRELHADGKLKAEWSARTTRDGRYLLDGKETHYWNNGTRQWDVTFQNGRKTGTETYWGPDGKKRWAWQHRANDPSIWTQWWPDGKKKAESTWKNMRCEGTASCWNQRGELVSKVEFLNGYPVK